MRPPRRARVAAALVALTLSGCFFKRPDGERLVAEVHAQAERITSLEAQLVAQRDAEVAARTALEAQVAEVKTGLDLLQQQLEATGRGSADLFADLAMLRELAQRLDGRLAEIDQGIAATQAQLREQDGQLEQQIRLLAQRAGIDVSLREADIPADRTEHYAAAYRAYQQPDHVRARALFAEYARRYTGDDNADNARYWIAKSYQDQQQYQRAIGAYREFLRADPEARSDVLDQALFAMSQAFYELHDCVNAREALTALKSSRPQSPLVRDADRRLRELRTPPRGYCNN